MAIIININKLIINNKLLPFTINSYPIQFSNILVLYLLRISITIIVLSLLIEIEEDSLDSFITKFPLVNP